MTLEEQMAAELRKWWAQHLLDGGNTTEERIAFVKVICNLAGDASSDGEAQRILQSVLRDTPEGWRARQIETAVPRNIFAV